MRKLFYLMTLLSVLCFSQTALAENTSFQTYLERCKDLRPTIEQILIDEGLPTYFFYLALAESGCDPQNKSNKNALGLFQIVPYTFKAYSKGVCYEGKPCTIEQSYDPIISTKVAARYLKSLYDRFDHNLDWTVAAYNAGGTNLKRKTQYHKGKSIQVVKSVYPQAYDLAMKVKNYSVLDKRVENNKSK